jgi:Lon protease-like protein
MIRMSLLPLFPLDVVLFPGAPLPLHIFEPRYKEMIGECLERSEQFGVVRAQETSLANVGCTADVIAVVKRHPDGRLDIVTQGRKRFEIVSLDQERSFLRGEVLLLEDDAGASDPEQVANARRLHGEMMVLIGASADIPPDGLLSFHLAAALPADLDFKQALLAMRSENERLNTLVQYYEAVLPKLQSMTAARQRAGGNGHGR